jgi:hypothetical protein
MHEMEITARFGSTLPPALRHDRSMDQRALERLGHHIVSRRVALGYRNRTDFAKSLQFTVRTLSDIENGVRKVSPGTYAMLENKLGWAPGSIETILAGGEPKELVVKMRPTTPTSRTRADTTEALSDATTDALSRFSSEELLLELLRRSITQPRRRRHETWDDWDDGPEPQSYWPEEG